MACHPKSSVQAEISPFTLEIPEEEDPMHRVEAIQDVKVEDSHLAKQNPSVVSTSALSGYPSIASEAVTNSAVRHISG